ncbi:SLAP domain-containing protein [Companilactobacillus jidongensis]|uniref:SLAP domain-containing protein n=1 Tax=Companilactobacillus jidongensis TaxID=2486006 RepID=UPI000F79534B|nr:SLAP domain-containing protein [Companilactobacillus jidongensis]
MNLFIKSAVTSMAAITLLSTGVLATSQKVEASASPIARTSKVTRIYTKKGNLVTNRSLASNTDWLTGKVITLNGEDYTQVATNEYVKNNDVSFIDPYTAVDPNKDKMVGRVIMGSDRVFDTATNSVSSTTLEGGSEWIVSKAISNKNGQTFYKISKTQWAFGENMMLNHQLNSTYDADFGVTPDNDPVATGSFGPASQSNDGLVVTINAGDANIYDDRTGLPTSKTVPEGSQWKVSRVVTVNNGPYYFKIGSHEWIEGEHAEVSQMPSPDHVNSFGPALLDGTEYGHNPSRYNGSTVVTGNDDSNTSSNTNTNTNTNTNNNTTGDTNNNSGSTNTNTNTGSYKPNVANINNYFVQYLNALHKANGTAPVHSSADMINYAQQRAAQQNGGNLDHSTAAKDTSENLSSTGFKYMNYAGVKSDKDAAYYLLKGWYDEEGNYAALGQAGHFGHRAALIYSGPTVGLGITDSDASFDADWNDSTLNAQNVLYNYTGTNPNTQFISKDAI